MATVPTEDIPVKSDNVDTKEENRTEGTTTLVLHHSYSHLNIRLIKMNFREEVAPEPSKFGGGGVR